MRAIATGLAIAAVILAFAGACGAASVGDVSFPDSITISNDLPALTLNGAGMRKKFIIKVYAGALYLPSKSSDPDAISSMAGPKRVLMHFVYDGVSGDKLIEAWREGFQKNLSRSLYDAMKPRLDQFCSMFTLEMKKGDEIALDMAPGKGTMVYIKGRLIGTIEGDDFYNNALLRVWLGPEPPDEGIKRGMLGLK